MVVGVHSGELRWRFFSRHVRRPPASEGESVKLPNGVEWAIWRLVTHERAPGTLTEIERDWSVADVFDANAVLDAFELAEYNARKRAERESRAKSRGRR